MIVVLQRDVCTPLKSVCNVGHVAVYNNNNVLLAVMWERNDGTVALTRAGEEDFERLCKEMHLDRHIKVRSVNV